MYEDGLFKALINRWGKTEDKIKFLHFTWTGKISVTLDCDKLCINNVIPRAKNVYKEIHWRPL